MIAFVALAGGVPLMYAAAISTASYDDNLAAWIAAVAFVVYVGGLILASLRQIARLLAYRKGIVIRHDFFFRGLRSGVWQRDAFGKHNHWSPWWVERIPPTPVPDLLKRDIWFTLGISWPFAATLTARALINAGLLDVDVLAGNAAWYLITSGPAVAAVIAYTYYEWFRIEKIDLEQEKRRYRVREILNRRFSHSDGHEPDEGA